MLSSCLRCTLSQGDNSCFRAEPVKKAIMVVSERPYTSEVASGKLFSSKALSLIDMLFNDCMEVTKDVYHLSYLVKCPADGDTSPESLEACSVYLREEISQVKPDVIVLLGEVVSDYVLGAGTYKAGAGAVHDLTVGDHVCKAIPTYSAGFARMNDHILHMLGRHLESAYNLAFGSELPVSFCEVELADTFEKVEHLIDNIKVTGSCCFDFETTDLKLTPLYSDEFKATCLSISYQLGQSVVIPLDHFETPFSKDDLQHIYGRLDTEVFSSKAIVKVAHNAKFDRHVLNMLGITLKGVLHDTMLMHHLLDEDSKHGLKELVSSYVSEYTGYEDEVRKYKWNAVPLEHLAPYAGNDTSFELMFFYSFMPKLVAEPKLYRIYRNEVLPAMEALWQAEAHGMLIDKTRAREYTRILETHIFDTTEALHKMKKVKEFIAYKNDMEREKSIALIKAQISELRLKDGKSSVTAIAKREGMLLDIELGKVAPFYDRVNFDSPKQMEELLYGEAGFKFKRPYNKKKGGDGGTGKDILAELGDKSGFVDLLLRSRALSKILGTYILGISKLADNNAMIHTSFLLHGTESGRLSSRNPNLQNIMNDAKVSDPVIKEVAPFVKGMFTVPEGYTILQVDFSQAELRIAAEFADEPVMLDAYNNDKDLHMVTAMAASRLGEEQWSKLTDKEKKDLRTKAKAGNFGLLYGMGAEGFKDYAKNNYGVVYKSSEAEDYRNAFMRTYRGLLPWHKTSIAKGQSLGFVTTLFGRRRHLPDIHHPIAFKKSEDERVAINSPVQGTAGELTIFAICLLQHRLDPAVKFVNTVHDSIVFYVPDALVNRTAKIVKYTCENLPTQQYFKASLKKVSMKVDLEVSKTSWKELKAYELK